MEVFSLHPFKLVLWMTSTKPMIFTSWKDSHYCLIAKVPVQVRSWWTHEQDLHLVWWVVFFHYITCITTVNNSTKLLIKCHPGIEPFSWSTEIAKLCFSISFNTRVLTILQVEGWVDTQWPCVTVEITSCTLHTSVSTVMSMAAIFLLFQGRSLAPGAVGATPPAITDFQ